MYKPNRQSGGASMWIILIIIAAVVVFFLTKDDTEEASAITEYQVTVRNVSDSQPLSPGVFVTHSPAASLNFEGSNAPAELEPLAEYGSHAAFRDFVGGVEGVFDVYTIDAPVFAGEETSFTISLPDTEEMVHISGVMMAVGSNDGYALLDSAMLGDVEETVSTSNYDAGTEENSELMSGFEGGQPDPDRGEENIENGTPTDPQAAVAAHPQLTSPLMEVVITPVMASDSEEEDDESSEE